MLNNPMAVSIAKVSPAVVQRNDFFTASVFALLSLSGKENIVIVHLVTEWSSLRVIVPFLHEEYTCLSSGVWFECIRMKSNYCKDSTALGYKVSYAEIAFVAESALR